MMALMCFNQPEFSSPQRKLLIEGDLSSQTANEAIVSVHKRHVFIGTDRSHDISIIKTLHGNQSHLFGIDAQVLIPRLSQL